MSTVRRSPGRSRRDRRSGGLPARRGMAAVTVLGVTIAGTALSVGTATPAIAWPSATVTINGHGYGHGRGMGQYGAFGYATKYGWTFSQILGHYYGGATVAGRGDATISVDLTGLDGSSTLAVTSGSAFTAAGVAVAAGGAAQLRYLGTNSYQLSTSAGCGKPWSAPKPVTSGAVSTKAPAGSLASLLTICAGDGSKRTYRGALALVSGAGVNRVVNTLPMEDYLRGVVPHESPASWGTRRAAREWRRCRRRRWPHARTPRFRTVTAGPGRVTPRAARCTPAPVATAC